MAAVKRYSAALVLTGLWLGFWALHAWFSWRHGVVEAREHGQVFDAGQFWLKWLEGTFENNQSEMLQVMVAAWVFKHFFWQGSPESKEVES